MRREEERKEEEVEKKGGRKGRGMEKTAEWIKKEGQDDATKGGREQDGGQKRVETESMKEERRGG